MRAQLEPEVVGRTIEGVEVLDERWTRPLPPGAVSEALAGRRIESVGRRGKYLLVGLDDGATLRHAPADDRESAAPGPGAERSPT